MNIFIAGGTGVIGTRLVPHLVERGYKIGVLSRSEVNREQILKMGADAVNGDIFDESGLVDITKKYDTIIHLATSIPSSTRYKPKEWEMNSRLRTDGVRNLMNAALVNGASHYIQQSFFGIYGHRDGELVDESTEIINPVPSLYKFSSKEKQVLNNVVEMEEMINYYIKEKSLPATILRFGWFYGHDVSLFQQMVDGQFPKIGKMKNYWNMLAIDDAVTAIIATIDLKDTTIGETFNINDNPVVAKDFIDTATEIGKGRRARSVPALLARLLVGKYGVNFTRSSVQISNKKARDILKWKPKFDKFQERIAYEFRLYSSDIN